MNKYLLVFMIAFVLVGCAKPDSPLYTWEQSYIDSNYKVLKNEADMLAQIDTMQEYLGVIESHDGKAPPGLFAHLGLLYYESGDLAKAEYYWLEESRLYPESKHFIEFLIKQKGAKQ